MRVLITFQHRKVHGIIGFLGNTEHHLQAVLDLPFTFFAARQQLLKRRTHAHARTYTKPLRQETMEMATTTVRFLYGGLPSVGADT